MGVFQTFQGMPVHHIPLSTALPPALSLIAAYCGWQFCSEVRAIAAGLNGDGSQDTCFVRFMGGGWWPNSITQSLFGGDDTRGTDEPNARFNNENLRYSMFGGSGHRLGED